MLIEGGLQLKDNKSDSNRVSAYNSYCVQTRNLTIVYMVVMIISCLAVFIAWTSISATTITASILILSYQYFKEAYFKSYLKKFDSMVKKEKNSKLELEKIIFNLSQDLEREKIKKKRSSSTLNLTKKFISDHEDLFCVISKGGYFVSVNAAWKEFFGYDNEEFYEFPLLCFVHDDDKKIIEKELNLLKAQYKKTSNFICRFRSKDNSYTELEWNATLLAEQGLIYAVAKEINELGFYENSDSLRAVNN